MANSQRPRPEPDGAFLLPAYFFAQRLPPIQSLYRSCAHDMNTLCVLNWARPPKFAPLSRRWNVPLLDRNSHKFKSRHTHFKIKTQTFGFPRPRHIGVSWTGVAILDRWEFQSLCVFDSTDRTSVNSKVCVSSIQCGFQSTCVLDPRQAHECPPNFGPLHGGYGSLNRDDPMAMEKHRRVFGRLSQKGNFSSSAD